MTTASPARDAASALNPREIRLRLGLNQAEFWSRIGVTQSGGSRYESGRAMPRPVQELLRVVHAEGVDLARVRREDIELLDFLKAHQPALLETLRASLNASRSPADADTAAAAMPAALPRQDAAKGYGSPAA